MKFLSIRVLFELFHLFNNLIVKGLFPKPVDEVLFDGFDEQLLADLPKNSSCSVVEEVSYLNLDLIDFKR